MTKNKICLLFTFLIINQHIVFSSEIPFVPKLNLTPLAEAPVAEEEEYTKRPNILSRIFHDFLTQIGHRSPLSNSSSTRSDESGKTSSRAKRLLSMLTPRTRSSSDRSLTSPTDSFSCQSASPQANTLKDNRDFFQAFLSAQQLLHLKKALRLWRLNSPIFQKEIMLQLQLKRSDLIRSPSDQPFEPFEISLPLQQKVILLRTQDPEVFFLYNPHHFFGEEGRSRKAFPGIKWRPSTNTFSPVQILKMSQDSEANRREWNRELLFFQLDQNENSPFPHINSPQLLQANQQGDIGIIMDFFPDGDLSSYRPDLPGQTPKHTSSLDERKKMILGLLETVCRSYQNHRILPTDLKGQNFLLKNRSQVFLADLGGAHFQGDPHFKGNDPFTLPYDEDEMTYDNEAPEVHMSFYIHHMRPFIQDIEREERQLVRRESERQEKIQKIAKENHISLDNDYKNSTESLKCLNESLLSLPPEKKVTLQQHLLAIETEIQRDEMITTYLEREKQRILDMNEVIRGTYLTILNSLEGETLSEKKEALLQRGIVFNLGLELYKLYYQQSFYDDHWPPHKAKVTDHLSGIRLENVKLQQKPGAPTYQRATFNFQSVLTDFSHQLEQKTREKKGDSFSDTYIVHIIQSFLKPDPLERPSLEAICKVASNLKTQLENSL